MKVLVACEESQAVCIAFRERGHEAYSCDILPCSGGHPEWHIQDDALNVINWVGYKEDVYQEPYWDMMIAFPPCTDLAVSGAKWFKEKQADGRQQASIDFFLRLTQTDIPKWAIENPIGIMSRLYRRPDQIIQPYYFGHAESKATCLWLKGLPLLHDTNNVKDIWQSLPKNKAQRIHYMSPGPERARLRSRTFPGIAAAMASQWSQIYATI